MLEGAYQTDIRLYRAISSGKEYENLIPRSNCKRINGGQGNTEHSVEQMKKVVGLYGFQTKKIAQKLNKSSLKDTCQSIQDFLYWHFQYKRDLNDQLLRSPACSFEQRTIGIDCKSYSIFGASILSVLGYKNYFRRVSYNENSPFSHVYVVVPKDQKTGDLHSGFYVIDGTLNKKTTEENYYYKKSDHLVMKMDHYILNAPQTYDYNESFYDSNKLTQYERIYLYQRGINPDNYGLNASLGEGEGDDENDAIVEFLMKLFEDEEIKKLFDPCKQKAAYTVGEFEENIKAIAGFIDADIVLMNDFLSKKDYKNFSIRARLIKTYIRMLREIFFVHRHRKTYNKDKKDWKNSCTKKNFDETIKFLEDKTKLGAFILALDCWLDDNFIKEQDSQPVKLIQKVSYKDHFLGKVLIYSINMHNYDSVLNYTDKSSGERVYLFKDQPEERHFYYPKLDKPEITFFEMTPFLESVFKNENKEEFNKSKYLDSLKNYATLFLSSTINVPVPPKNNNTLPVKNQSNKKFSSIKNATPISNIPIKQVSPVASKQAGMFGVVGFLIVAAGVGYMVMNNKKSKKSKK